MIDDPKITENNAIDWRYLSLDKEKMILSICPYDDVQLRAPLDAPNLLSLPSHVVIQQLFPLQPAFAITVDKAQGQTLDRVIVALSKRQLSITNFQYACLYVALSRVRKKAASSNTSYR